MVSFSVRSLVKEVVSQFLEAARIRDLKLLTEVSDEVPEMLEGRSWLLGQVLTNLVGNAVYFTESGEITVSLRTVRTEAADDNAVDLCCEVRNAGAGIAAEIQAQVFERTFEEGCGNSQTIEAESRLRLTRKLVELMGGRLALAAKAGTGSTFWFKVRLEKAAGPASGAVPTDAEVGHGGRRGKRGVLPGRGAVFRTSPSPSPPGAGRDDLAAMIDEKVLHDLRILERDSPNLLASLVNRYLADSPRHLEALRWAVRNGAWTDLRDAAHSLKSRSELLGARGLAELCRDLEFGSKQGAAFEVEMLLGRIESAHAQVCRALATIGGVGGA